MIGPRSRATFIPKRCLFPAARPARALTVAAFIERMKGLAGSSLIAFSERMLGADVHVFGNIAIARAACEIVENDEKTTRGVEALLFVKDDGVWRIVAQHWDVERDGLTVPAELLDGTA